MQITDIKPQSKSKSRVSIFIDGEFFCGMEKLALMERRLRIGDEVDADELAEAVKASECTSAFERAANYLGARPRTRKEIKTYLVGKGYSEQVVASTLDKLCEYGYVDDAEYCRIYVETYKHKSGARKLEAELRAKGIDFNLIDDALAGIEDEGQADAATKLAEKYLRSHEFDKRKLSAYLLSKGFTYDDIKKAVSTIEETDE